MTGQARDEEEEEEEDSGKKCRLAIRKCPFITEWTEQIIFEQC